MPATNVDVVRRSFEAYTAGGIEAALRFYSRDFVWDPGPDWIEDRAYRGHDGARALDAIFSESFDGYVIEAHEILAMGERVLALFEAVGTIKGTGAPLRQPFGIVLSDFQDGTIGKVRSYFSWQEASEAVGLAG